MNDAQHPLNALPQGYRLQEYELVRVLGFGGFGMTYLGFDHNLDKGVAIKEYLPADIATRTSDNSVAAQASHFRDDFEWGLDRFLDEARVLARFDHRNIIKVYRFFEAHGTAYIVMEYAEGETLSAYLQRKNTLKEVELKAVLYPILDGLEVVHGADFLHRDIKPSNIILRDEDRSPVLLDFGAARQAIGARSRSVTSILTPGYAPIEQYSSRARQGPYTDIYALGAVCYHALTGSAPDDATDRVRHDPLIRVSERCAGQASGGLLSAVDWALRVNEHDRPQSVASWRAALTGESVEDVPEPPVATEPVSLRRTEHHTTKNGHAEHVIKPKTRRVGRVVGVLCLFAGLGGGGYYYYEGIHLPEQRRMAQEAKRAQETAAQDAVASRQLSMRVSVLLAGASEDLASNRLTSPAGNNAWEKYQAVLELSPGNPTATKGLENIIASYQAMFEAALGRGDFSTAEGYVSRIRNVRADSPVLSVLANRLSSARTAESMLRRQQEAETARLVVEETAQRRQAQIASYELKFEEGLGHNDFDFASRYLDSIRVVNANAPVLSGLEGRLSAERKLKALRLEQEAKRAKQQAAEDEERLHQARIASYKRTFETSLRVENLNMAGIYVDSLRSVNADVTLLSDLEGRLSAAREREVGRTFKDCGYCPEMIVIPSGSFTMGSPESEDGRDKDEGPRHRVRINYRFAVGIYEITFREWDVCAASGRCRGFAPDDEGWGRENRPVINVSWDDAQSYVTWLSDVTGESYRMLSESEWEYAARAGSFTAYTWGNRVGRSRAVCNGCGSRWDSKRTAPVGSFPANAWGLHDMHGNVWEWVRDCWQESYYRAPSDGSPSERGDCTKRVLRGGAWDTKPMSLRAADRVWVTADSRYKARGFRIARTLSP